MSRRLFSDPASALGAHLTLNSTDYTVIGVAGAQWDIPSEKTEFWTPSTFERGQTTLCCNVQLLGRLRPEVSLSAARADVADTALALASDDAKLFGRLHTTVTSLRDKQLGDGRSVLFLLWATVGIVLVVACVNVVNLLVARNVSRTRELSIRQALGATRSRLLLRGLIEAGLLAGVGVAGALAIARAATRVFTFVDVQAFPRLHNVRLDTNVFAFAATLGLATTLATGLVPVMQAMRLSPPHTMTNAPTRHRRRLQQGLCAAQLGAAALLLVVATLFIRSLVGLLNTDVGITPQHVVTASINAAFRRPHSADEIAATMLRVAEGARQIHGVRAVGVGTSLPPDTSRITMSLKGKTTEVPYQASAILCTPGYFQALGIRLLSGRFFTETDDAEHTSVIIVSATTARHLFGPDDPIGQTFTVPNFPYRRTSSKEATVVGVVSDVKYAGLDATAGDQIYWSMAQAPWLSTFLAIRTTGDVAIASELRHIVSSIDPTIAVSSIRSLDDILATAAAPARFRTALIITFTLITVAIASIGLYGIVSYTVSQRTSEIGIRVALGADAHDVTTIILREGAMIATMGLAIGLPAAYATSRTVGALLFGVKVTDPTTYLIATVALFCVALAASYAPARRAARIDPIIALRAE